MLLLVPCRTAWVLSNFSLFLSTMVGLLSPPLVHKYLNGMILREELDSSCLETVSYRLFGIAFIIVWAMVWIILHLGIYIEGRFTDQEIRDDRSVASILPASCAYFYSYVLSSGLIMALQTAHSWPAKFL